MSKADIAAEKHIRGYNCAQAVACSFAEELGIDESIIYKMAEGFGGGMGTAKGICGALSGAALVCGLVKSDGDIDSPGATKAASCRMSGKIQREFAEKVGDIICADIKSGKNGKGVTSCMNCIRIAADLVEKEISNFDINGKS